MNILILGHRDYDVLFADYGDISHSWLDFDASDIILFTGGDDVSPSLYEEDVGRYTAADINRDKIEKELFRAAVDADKFMVGVCRGAQLGCVLSGGSLIQHVEGHQEAHLILTKEGQTLQVSSSHHQMMMPYHMPLRDWELLAWSTALSNKYLGGNNETHEYLKEIEGATFMEPEVIYFRNTRFLAVQFHPEWMNNDTKGRKYFGDTVTKFYI